MKDVIRIFHILIWFGLAYKFGDWKNFKKYYPTIMFFALGDLIYCLVFRDNPLWALQSNLISFPYVDLFTIPTVFAATTLIYLTHFPNKQSYVTKVLYIALWCFIYTGIEAIFSTLSVIKYYNNWSLGLSSLHNVYQFILLKIHHEKPLAAWVLAILILSIFMNIYNISILR